MGQIKIKKTTEASKLQKEIQTFRARIEDFLKENADKFVLIKGDEVIGFFNSRAEGYQAGLDKFGLELFLVKRVEEEKPLSIASIKFKAK